MPAECGMGFIVVTHLDPNHKSLLPEIIGRSTAMEVRTAQENDIVEPNRVYVLPEDALLTIAGGRLHLRHLSTLHRERTPIDILFSALAEDQGENAIGIVL